MITTQHVIIWFIIVASGDKLYIWFVSLFSFPNYTVTLLVQVCPLHWTFAVLASVAVPCPEKIQIAICRTCIALSSLLLIVRMIYQIDYIDPEEWVADCSVR